jgi:hypothetical protein
VHSLVFIAALVEAKRAFQVSCYIGDRNIGTLELYDPTYSAITCNKVFHDCEGNCTGCYMNIDNKQVCIDSQGQVYSD